MPPASQSKPRSLKPGVFIASYRLHPMRRGELLSLFALAAAAVLVPVLYGYSRAQYALTKYGPIAAAAWSRPWYLLAGVAMLVGAALLVYRLTTRRRRIDVHKNGILLRRSRVKYLPWTGVAGIASGTSQTFFLGLPLRTHNRVMIYPTVGKPLRLDSSIENLPELLTRLKASVYPRLLEQMSPAFAQGGRLYFGPLSITQSSLQFEIGKPPARNLPWSQLRSVSVQSGVLVVEPEQGQALKIPAFNIPNLELLLQIIQSGVKK